MGQHPGLNSIVNNKGHEPLHLTAAIFTASNSCKLIDKIQWCV